MTTFTELRAMKELADKALTEHRDPNSNTSVFALAEHIANYQLACVAYVEELLASGGIPSPTEAMIEAGRNAVMARDCSGAKWSPRQHYEASGTSTEGIPDDLLNGYHSIIPKAQGALLVWYAMYSAMTGEPK